MGHRGDHRPAAGSERAAGRPRVGGVPRRPWDAPRRDSPPRPSCAGCPTVHLRRRRARLGARPGRALRRGSALARPRAAARDARRAHLLPPRVRGRLCRRPPGDARLVPEGHRAEPRVLGAVGASRPKGHSRETRRCAGGRLRSRHGRDTRTTGRRRCAPARELHRQPLRGHRARRQPRVRAVRPRPRRDPDVPGRRTRPRARVRGRRRARARAPHRRNTSPPRARLAPRVVTSGSGRPADAPLRGDLSSVTRRPVGVVRRPHVREPDRLAGDHGLGAGRCAARGRIRAGGEPVRRAARLSASAPPVSAGRAGGDRALRAGRHRGGAPRRSTVERRRPMAAAGSRRSSSAARCRPASSCSRSS